MNTFIDLCCKEDSDLFIVQGFVILDILPIQHKKNFHNQRFFKLFELLTFAVLIKRIYFLLSNFARLSMHNLHMAVLILCKFIFSMVEFINLNRTFDRNMFHSNKLYSYIASHFSTRRMHLCFSKT